MKKISLFLLFVINLLILYAQGNISFGYSTFNISGKAYTMKGVNYEYANVEELIKILNNTSDTIEQIVIEDNNITNLPVELYKLKHVSAVQIISKSITEIDKGFIKMDNLVAIECILDSIGTIFPKIYKSKKLWNINIDATNYNPGLQRELPILVKKFEKRKRYLVIKAGELFYETPD